MEGSVSRVLRRIYRVSTVLHGKVMERSDADHLLKSGEQARSEYNGCAGFPVGG